MPGSDYNDWPWKLSLVRAEKTGLGKVRHSAEVTGSVEVLGSLKDLLKLEYL